MQNSIASPPPATAALTDHNALARIYAHTLPEQVLIQESQRRLGRKFAYPLDCPMVFVKFGHSHEQAEGDMQRLAFDWLSLERIYVPEVYKIFTRDGVTFIVMEFIQGSRVWDFAKWFEAQYWEDHKSKYYDLIVEGIQLLRRMPVPDDATPGPRTSSKRIIHHTLFKDDEAPIEYHTVGELQDHLNKVAKFAYHNNPHPPTVNLEKELVFCYTDFDDENFMFTTSAHGRLRLYIVDFELASFLPMDFFAYAVLVDTPPCWFMASWIRDRIGSSLPQDNLEVMQRIYSMFQISWWGAGLSQAEIRHVRGH